MKKLFLPLLLITNLSFAQVDLNLGLRAYYPFSGNANDISGNNNNPVFNNATLTADRFGNPNSAYHFNGTNNYMRILNSPTLNMANKLSISLWVKPTGWYTGQCYNNMMLMKGDADYLPGNYSLRFSDVYNGCSATPSTTEERFYDGSGTVATLPIVQLNQWYSVIITYDGTTARLYINCVLQATSASALTFTNAYDIYLGHLNNAQFPYWLNGDLDEVRIYDRALTVDEVNVLGGCTIPLTCNNWLNTPSQGSYVTTGDLDITGNQLTVEAVYNRTAPLNGGLYYGHLVSKHSNSTDVNYALLPNGCEITTTNGYKSTFQSCPPDLNKTYHIAMVYDGTNLKYYRNGFLLSQVACTGNMITNNLQTTIAQVAGAGFPSNNQFLGYTNEVRIWNVARTQSQLRTYMDASLPNPTTQAGLQAYYTFDNLLNKQGNVAYNANLNGASAINATNTNCSFVPDSCAVACNNWLRTQAVGQSVTVGDLDISGNQVTVEANFNCSSFPISRPDKQQDIVSKHSNTTDINYVLRMDLAGITTTNGQFLTPIPCDELALNKTYHVAMVYNGSTLKLYRNGFLMSQVAVTGNLILNNWQTTIGDYAVNNPVGTNFLGYINEVRIWNVARTQSELRTYMNTSLPNPATQTGLRGYYTFDNLLNKQGNAAYNGTLNGGATINNTNPNCSFVADSCALAQTSTVINAYSPVLSLDPCINALTVENGSAYNVGDTVLLIQMKGAVIDSTNTAAFGTVTDYKNSGNYEFNYVKSRSGNIIELLNKLTRQYDIPVGKVQLIRVPYYNDLTTTDTLTCLPWDGNKGGVLVFNVLNTLTLNANIDVSGKGFKGAPGFNPGNATLNCFHNNYNYPLNSLLAAQKGESITAISSNIICGKGSPAGGGGGGLGHNSGGGGGGNAGSGGFGGYQLQPCGNAPFDNRGIGGKQLAYSNAANKIYMGSGGGAGQADNPGNIPPAGGNGAGIVIISADKVRSNSRKIIANGAVGLACSIPASPDCHDGMGGGGAGGTILLSVNQFLDNSLVEVKGGNGANMVGSVAAGGRIGAGGGGGGGLAFLKPATIPANLAITNSGGANGVLTTDGNSAWGATPGNAGQNLFNLVLPIDQVPFQKNIDSVRIKDSVLNCNGFDFKGLAYTNTNPIAGWQWYFGDGNTANTQNTTHAYAASGTYTVKLVVTDINGCKDSITKVVVTSLGVVANAGQDTSFCSNSTVIHVLQGSGNGTYSWTPAIYLNDPTLQNPTATVSSTTTFYLTVTGTNACTSIDSVTIFVNPLPVVQTLPDTSICKLSPLVLTTTSGPGTYHWSPGIYVSDSTIASPVFIDTLPRILVVTRTNAAGCFTRDTININIKPLPAVKTIEDTLICSTNSLTLFSSGAQTYSWTPSTYLSNPNIASPVYSGNQSQTYIVTGTGINGCAARDTVTVNVNVPRLLNAPPDKTMCNQSFVQLDGFNGTSVEYLWSPSNYLSSTTIINPVSTTPASIVYSVIITDRACNYDSSFNVNVVVLPAPVINAGKSNDIDCANRSATLSASGGNQYTWSPATGLSNANIPNPVATPASTQQYIVQVTNGTGCANTDTVTVFVNNTASLARYMPNAFTPDGNGRNDCYGLKSWMYIKQLQFYIFNRYGEQVFATSNPNTCWDGMYKGKPALAGAYVYVIKAQTDCGVEEQKGNFLLIR